MSTHTTKTGAIVLAGGRSRRMGRDKASLPLGDKTLLQHVVTTLEACCAAIVVAGPSDTADPRSGAPASTPTGRDPHTDSPLGVAWVDDVAEFSGQGPLAGIAAGLEHLAREGMDVAVIVACDAVWISAAHVDCVTRFLQDALAAVPVSIDEDDTITLHPLCGAVRVAAAREAALALLGAGERRAWQLYEHLHARHIAAEQLPDSRILWPCNTPEEWERLLQQHIHTPKP